jgi:hypothetical protein
VIGFAVESPAHDESLPGPDTLRYLPQIGHAVTGTGAMLAGALANAADLVADRENRRLRALARLGRGHRSARHRRGFKPALRRVRHPGTPPVDRLQIGALLHRYENAAAASVIFVIGALHPGRGQPAAGRRADRTHITPLWGSALVPLGMVANIAALAASSRPLLIGSSAVLLVPLGFVALSGRLPWLASAGGLS